MPDDGAVLELDGQEVAISNPHKVFFPERGETKLDLVRYYEAVGEPLLATMGGRPVLLQRYPDGAGGSPVRLAEQGDPWASMYDDPQSLEPVLELHARDMAAGLLDAPWPPVYPKQPNEPPRVAPSRAKRS